MVRTGYEAGKQRGYQFYVGYHLCMNNPPEGLLRESSSNSNKKLESLNTTNKNKNKETYCVVVGLKAIINTVI